MTILIDKEKLIHDLIQILHDDVCAPNGHLDPYYVFKVIKDQPQLATNLQLTCNQLATDCISRQAAIDALDCINGAEEVLKALPSVQPDQRSFSCGQENDLISRQDAIEAILAVTGNSSVRELYEHVQEHGLSDMWSGGVNAAIDIIIAVPSAQPEKLTDKEQRIFLSAMGREEEVCKEVDDAWKDCREPYEESLVHVCKEIRRKVKDALWT